MEGDSSAISFDRNEEDIKKQLIIENSGKKVMSIETQRLIVEITKNYNKLTNRMIAQCGKLCFKNLDLSDLTMSENKCLDNCLSKYYNTYVTGEKLRNYMTDKINEGKINSVGDVIDTIEQASNSINI